MKNRFDMEDDYKEERYNKSSEGKDMICFRLDVLRLSQRTSDR